MRCFVLFALAAAAFGADSDFNGRWDLNPGPGRAWWMEIEGAGTPQIKGSFVGFPSGGLDAIKDAKITDGVLTFTSAPVGHQQYKVRYSAGALAGTMRRGESEPPVAFSGKRAPVIRDHDDGSWVAAAPEPLFNGKDLTGWVHVDKGWQVENGFLNATGRAANLLTTRKFWNFLLHVEYNVARESNSGIGLRGRYEVQIQDDYGKPPERHINGSIYSRITPSTNASKPAGEWQTVDIRLIGRNVTVTLNGQRIIDKQEIAGLTGIAIDPDEDQPGPIELQGDHGPVSFRNVTLTRLSQKQPR